MELLEVKMENKNTNILNNIKIYLLKKCIKENVFLHKLIKSFKKEKNKVNEFKSILDLNSSEVKDYFMQSKNYCSIDLPEYFDFSDMLDKLKSFNNSDMRKGIESDDLKNSDKVNFKFLVNKDGKNAWREFQLIHPVFYVYIVNEITKKKKWDFLIKLLKERKNKIKEKIKCCSIPIYSKNIKKDTIKNWWDNIEQEFIKQSLNYKYLYITDISDCYPSIYTHSIAWAIHGIKNSKNNKNDKEMIGNFLDTCFRKMSYNQTNGIPQGNVLSDFVAEIILSACDEELYKKLEEKKIKNYFILRYRDDYRIFINSKEDGDEIIKHLTEILYTYNFKLNSKKTIFSDDIITSSIKPEKYNWITSNKFCENKTIQKKLLVIYEFSKKFQNTNILNKLLKELYKENIYKKSLKYENLEILLSILSEILSYNPITYKIISIIFIYLIKRIKDDNIRTIIINDIIKKIDKIRNNLLIELFIQKIFEVGLRQNINNINEYNQLSKIVDNIYNSIQEDKKIIIDNDGIWNNSWIIPEELKNIIKTTSIVNIDKIKKVIKNPETKPKDADIDNTYN